VLISTSLRKISWSMLIWTRCSWQDQTARRRSTRLSCSTCSALRSRMKNTTRVVTTTTLMMERLITINNEYYIYISIIYFYIHNES
jgi:hypothetical protein